MSTSSEKRSRSCTGRSPKRHRASSTSTWDARLAERLGYPSDELNAVPPEAIESFAGVGYHLGMAAIASGERVVDLGSGSGMDAFLAARLAGTAGEVVGIDMTEEQLTKARRLAERDGHTNARFEKGYIDPAPIADGSVDVVISNGVINLCDDKKAIFSEIAPMLKPDGRMAISDIVTEHQLLEAIVHDVNLWASCIGGAMQQDEYPPAIEAAGLEVNAVEENDAYRFISESAWGRRRRSASRACPSWRPSPRLSLVAVRRHASPRRDRHDATLR